MAKYILKRILLMIPVMIGVLTIAFILNKITPGDPARTILGSEASEEEVYELREEMGLNEPMLVQYGKYIWGVFTRLDLGTSYSTDQPILTEILERYPTTIKLAFGSVLVAVLIGVPLGMLSAVYQNSWIDNLCMTLSLLGVSIPNFWLGLMNILLFSVTLHWLPASGLSNGWMSWILPIVCIAVGSAATIARITRSSMLEVIRQDYVRTAKAKGQRFSRIIFVHTLRNALIPIVTVIGNQIGHQLGGAILAETVFGLPGLGSYMVGAIKARNYPAVQGGVVFLSIIFSLVNLLVDILFTFINPQLRTSFVTAKKKKKAKPQISMGGAVNG